MAEDDKDETAEMPATDGNPAKGVDTEEAEFEKTVLRAGQDLEVDPRRLPEMVQSNCARAHRYLEMLSMERKAGARLESIRRRLYRKLMQEAKFKNDYRFSGIEVDRFVAGDPNMSAILDLINKSKRKIDYLERVLDLFKARGYSLKDMVVLKKMEAEGIV
jgi:hypothetical protein